MSDVYVGRFNRFFEKLFNIKGGPAVVDVEPSIRMSLPVPFGMEERYLLGIESFAASQTQGGVAANKSAAMIRNPLGSNTIVVLEKINIAPGVAESIALFVAGSNPADLATPVSNSNRADPRGRSVGSAIVSEAAPATDPGTGFLLIGTFQLQSSISTELILFPDQEIVLLPQIALRVVGQTVNTAMTFTFFWRERPLETSEFA